MSASTEPNVTIQAPRDVETFIIDHAFNLVTRGLGDFTASLPPGLYKFKFRRGLAVIETLEEIAAEPRTIVAPKIEVSSSVPLASSRSTDESQLHAARRMSSEIHETIGNGSSIFIFARWKPGDRDAASDAATGLALHALDGTLLVDLQQKAQRDGTSTGCNIALDPGAYRLRLTSGDEPLEQTIIASPGWQTQVFLMQELGTPALASASILMSRGGFDPESEMLQLADAARIALKEKRTVMPRELLSRLLDDQFDNPMLAIYAAHALASEKPDEIFTRVLSALERLVPDHPDVAAVQLVAGAKPVEITAPPMLRASWNRILPASFDGAAILQPGTLASRIPAALLDGTPWLIWSPNALLEPEEAVARDVSGDLKELQARIADLIEADSHPADLSGPEEELFSYLHRRARIQKRTTRGTPLATTEKDLAMAFGTTVANVQAAVCNLANKLRGGN